MVTFFHGLLMVFAYAFIVVFCLLFLCMAIALLRLIPDLKVMSAPSRKHELTEQFYQPEWNDLTPDEQATAMKRLPVTIFGYILVWASLIGAIYFSVKLFFPAVITFFSNL